LDRTGGVKAYLGALLLGYYTDNGKLIYAGRVGTGMPDRVLADLHQRLKPLYRARSPLKLSRVHWVEPKLVAEITYLTWIGDGLLQQTVFVGLRSDKSARAV
jgi:bifunctional non-homologous end joining protein LigD